MKIGGLSFPPKVMAYVAAGDPELGLRRCERYAAKVSAQFKKMRDWLPTNCGTVLDIGSGLAGIDVLIARHSGAKTIHLVDGDGTGPRNVGFGKHVTAWADVNMGAAMIRANVRGRSIVTHQPDPRGLAGIAADLVISLQSWGHHYPVSTYLDAVRAAMHPASGLIVDIRRGTDGMATLKKAGFGLHAKIDETPKCERFVLVA